MRGTTDLHLRGTTITIHNTTQANLRRRSMYRIREETNKTTAVSAGRVLLGEPKSIAIY